MAGTIAGGAPAWELPAAEQAAVVEVNLLATIAAARVGIPALLSRPQPRSGRFVALASAAATRGMPGLAAYSPPRPGSAASSAVSPPTCAGPASPPTRSPRARPGPRCSTESARLYELDSPEHFASQQPLERLIEPAEIAAAVAWLLGPGAAAVTGALIPVDGGLAL